jgi:hypothetical protein
MINSHVEPASGLDKITKNALIVSALGAAAGTIYAAVTGDLTVPIGAGCGFIGGLIGGIARGLVMSLPRQR